MRKLISKTDYKETQDGLPFTWCYPTLDAQIHVQNLLNDNERRF